MTSIEVSFESIDLCSGKVSLKKFHLTNENCLNLFIGKFYNTEQIGLI